MLLPGRLPRKLRGEAHPPDRRFSPGCREVVARIVAPGIGEALGGQSWSTPWRANGIIGMEARESGTDGYTIGLVSISAMASTCILPNISITR